MQPPAVGRSFYFDVGTEIAKHTGGCLHALLGIGSRPCASGGLDADRTQQLDRARAALGPHDLFDELGQDEGVGLGEQLLAIAREAVEARGLATRIALRADLLDDAVTVQGSDVHAHGVVGESQRFGETGDGPAGAPQEAEHPGLRFSEKAFQPLVHGPE